MERIHDGAGNPHAIAVRRYMVRLMLCVAMAMLVILFITSQADKHFGEGINEDSNNKNGEGTNSFVRETRKMKKVAQMEEIENFVTEKRRQIQIHNSNGAVLSATIDDKGANLMIDENSGQVGDRVYFDHSGRVGPDGLELLHKNYPMATGAFPPWAAILIFLLLIMLLIMYHLRRCQLAGTFPLQGPKTNNYSLRNYMQM